LPGAHVPNSVPCVLTSAAPMMFCGVSHEIEAAWAAVIDDSTRQVARNLHFERWPLAEPVAGPEGGGEEVDGSLADDSFMWRIPWVQDVEYGSILMEMSATPAKIARIFRLCNIFGHRPQGIYI